MSSSSSKPVSVHVGGVQSLALAYTPSQNCSSFSKLYETSNSIAQIVIHGIIVKKNFHCRVRLIVTWLDWQP